MNIRGEFTMGFFMSLIIVLAIFAILLFLMYSNFFPGAEKLADSLNFVK